MKNNILIINNIKKVYHSLYGETTAIDNISLSVSEGEYIAIVGPSGCGKSTLLSVLCGLEKKSDGDFIFPNIEKTKLGYMLQQDSLFPWLTILDNCLLGLKIQKKLSKENIKYVMDLLETYGLKEFINVYPKSLSGGMKQRVV